MYVFTGDSIMQKYKTNRQDKNLAAFYNAVKEEIKNKKIVSSSKEVVKDNMDLHLSKKEIVRVLYMDSANRKLGTYETKGIENQCTVYVKEIVRKALDLNAVSAITMHNHPAKSKSFSHSDVTMTRKLFVALESIGMELLDHILFYGTGHESMRDSYLWAGIKKSFL